MITHTLKKFWMSINSLSGRMFVSHILVAVLTAGIIVLSQPYTWLLSDPANYTRAYNQLTTKWETLLWLVGDPEDIESTWYRWFDGYTLIIDQNEQIVHIVGEAPCEYGSQLKDCAPELINATNDIIDLHSDEWIQTVVPMVTGHAAISRARYYPPLQLAFRDMIMLAISPLRLNQFAQTEGPIVLLIVIPTSLTVVWLLLRPKVKRLESIIDTSKRFASGDLRARAEDTVRDDVGEWARHFDDMADTLAQNIVILRDLARQNVELIHQVEQGAIQQERLRLSRDLHDSVAQRLFSLTVSTSTLPDILQRDPEHGLEHARTVADLAQETLLDLRALLIELRPVSIIQLGFGEALRKLCVQVEATHGVRTNCSILLFRGHLPTSAQDTLYRVSQEALSNAVKHADASQIDLSVVQGKQQISLSVTDNGVGIDSSAKTAGLGLHTMRERALSLGGCFEIESKVNHGTTIRVQLPLTPEGAANRHDPDTDN